MNAVYHPQRDGGGGRKGVGGFSIRYNTDSDLQIIIKVPRFKRLTGAVNSNEEQSCLLSCATGLHWGTHECVCVCIFEAGGLLSVSAFSIEQRYKGERMKQVKA